MGSSRRRKAQKTSSHLRVKVGLPRVKAPKAPKEITMPGEDKPAQWDIHRTPKENYDALGLERDAMPRGGRNSKAKVGTMDQMVKDDEFKLDADDEDKTFQSDAYDELRALCAKERSTGKALPQRLTTKQRNVMKALIDVHGANIGKMARDTKLNRMQHSEGVLRKMVVAFITYPCLEDGGYRGFHAPKKSLGANVVRGRSF